MVLPRPILMIFDNWLTIVEDELNVRPVIYTAAWYWNDARFGGPVPWASDYRLWVSSFNYYAVDLPTDWNTYWMWQFSGMGNKRGHHLRREQC